VAEPLAEVMTVGDHGTTFGGGPFVSTVARVVLRTVSHPDFLAGVREKAAVLAEALRALRERSARVRDVRGVGLIWGVEVDGPASDVVARAREGEKLLLAAAGKDVVRLLPPLNVEVEVLLEGVARLERALG
jgi:acetylornithine/succinyldiaminopimelate/putrescine aminotransferase